MRMESNSSEKLLYFTKVYVNVSITKYFQLGFGLWVELIRYTAREVRAFKVEMKRGVNLQFQPVLFGPFN